MNTTETTAHRSAGHSVEIMGLPRTMSCVSKFVGPILLLLASFGWTDPAMSSGDPIAGQSAYVQDCALCHGPRPSRSVLAAANDPDLIGEHIMQIMIEEQDRWGSRPRFRVVGSFDDIAAYLASLVNYQGLRWSSPAGSESGWGINVAHQADVIFATWFTYDLAGKGLWMVMTAPEVSTNVYSGILVSTTGPAFNATPFDSTQVAETPVGTGTLSFTDLDHGTFSYVVNGVSQTKEIVRQSFGRLLACSTADGNLATATNYQDLWWASPGGSEAGWGISFSHQGDTIFATWFTYDVDRTPMWLVASAIKTAPGTYSGALYRTAGPPFNAVPFDPADVVTTPVGTATFTFSDGNNASFAYVVNGVAQVKAITRQVFRSPGTMCH